MTLAQTARLAEFIHQTDFISDLVAARPALDDANWKDAAGWEKCVRYIIQLAQPPETPPRSRTIDTSKLDPKV